MFRSQSRDRSSSPDEKKKKHKKHKKHKSHKRENSDVEQYVKTEKIEEDVIIPGLGTDSPQQSNIPLKTEEQDAPRGDGTSLSIEETNKLRIKLGLKPLDVNGAGGATAGGETKKDDFVHQPPENISSKMKQEKIKEKLKQMKKKREINKKLGKVSFSEKLTLCDFHLFCEINL